MGPVRESSESRLIIILRIDEIIENCHNLDFFIEKLGVSSKNHADLGERKQITNQFVRSVALVENPIEFRWSIDFSRRRLTDFAVEL